MISLLRNNDVWSDRLREDRAILEAQLTEEQDQAIRHIVERRADGGELEFLVVYGSVSRGEQRPDSDLDIYYETRDADVDSRQANPDSPSHVFSAAAGALRESLESGDAMAFAIVSDALVVYDAGLFRDLCVAVDEGELKPSPVDETAPRASTS
ncbi:MAG: nucleotidyltransferase domain-containing protein [Gaiellaceae bacterium]